MFPRSHIPSKMKTNLNLKSGIAAFSTDLATYRSNNPSSSSHLSLKQKLKSTPTVPSSIPTPVICTTSSAKNNRDIMIQNKTFQIKSMRKMCPSQALPFKKDLTLNQSESLVRASRRFLLEKAKRQDVFFKLLPPPKVAILGNPFSDGLHLSQESESRWTGKSTSGRIHNNSSVECSPSAYRKTTTVIRTPIINPTIPSSTLTSKDLSNR